MKVIASAGDYPQDPAPHCPRNRETIGLHFLRDYLELDEIGPAKCHGDRDIADVDIDVRVQTFFRLAHSCAAEWQRLARIARDRHPNQIGRADDAVCGTTASVRISPIS